MAKVVLRNVTKVFKGDRNNDFVAVKNFSLEIEDREFMVFVGSSGCGKSTTLRMIAGLEEITNGEVLIGDRRVNDVAPKDRDIAMVFQNYALYPHMSVFDNMAFGLKLRKIPKKEIQKRVSDAAEILGLGELLERKPKALSGGQRQRVAVGRAIVRQPKVFLFDEPLSNLDAKMRVQMRTELTHLHQRLDATMIYVTHDQVEAMTMGTRIAVMSHGEIQQVDAPLKLYDKPKNLFVAGFLGSPSMNFIHGSLRRTAGGLVFKEDNQGTIELNLGDRPGAAGFIDKKIILGVRPEDCTVLASGASAPQACGAIVDLIEPTGAETLFHLQTGAHMLVSRNAGLPEPASVGHRIEFKINAARTQLFDPVSTNRIV